VGAGPCLDDSSGNMVGKRWGGRLSLYTNNCSACNMYQAHSGVHKGRMIMHPCRIIYGGDPSTTLQLAWRMIMRPGVGAILARQASDILDFELERISQAERRQAVKQMQAKESGQALTRPASVRDCASHAN